MIGALDPAQHRQRLGEAARHRSVRLRRVVHARARARRGLAREDAAHRRRRFRPPAPASSTSATTARLSYALGEEREMPTRAGDDEQEGRAGRRRSSSRRSSASLAFGPFKSWNALVSVVTARDGDHVRVRAAVAGGAAQGRRRPAALVPRADAEARAAGGVLLGEPDHLLGRVRHDVEARASRCWSASRCSRSAPCARRTGAQRTLGNAIWMAPWLGGHVVHRRDRPLRRRHETSCRTGSTSAS